MPLDGIGKRAAFALYYGPLHFLLIQHIVRAISARSDPVSLVIAASSSILAVAAAQQAPR